MSKMYWATAFSGGNDGCLDAIDGYALADGDRALVVIDDGDTYLFTLNATSGATESYPNIISPDFNAGTKRWIMQNDLSPTVGFRNKLINGNFDIWQRGTSFSTSEDLYTADRWTTYVNSDVTFTLSQQSFTVGQTDVPSNPTYFCRNYISANSGGASTGRYMLRQKIEDVNTFSGKTITISFYAKVDSAKDIAIEFIQNFGTGGSSQITAIDVQTFSLTTSWVKYTATFDIPSISGYTVGTDSTLILAFWFSAGSNYDLRTNSLGIQTGTFDIAQVQLEAGYVATEFEERPIGVELDLCQRYFEKSYELETDIGTSTVINAVTFRYGSDTASVYHPITFEWSVRKRGTPTLTLYSTDGPEGYVKSGSDGDLAVSSVARVGDERGGYIITSTNITSWSLVGFHWVADAEL